MNPVTRITVLTLILSSMLLPGAMAQGRTSLSVGTFHSPKGFGASVEVQGADHKSFDAFTLMADVHGILMGEFSTPGYKFSYTRDIIFKHVDKSDHSIDYYAGPGLTAGYARDINEPHSLIAGLAGAGGCRFVFERGITVNLELGSDIAFLVNRDERYGNLEMKLYKSGIYHILYPQLRIHYQF